MVTRITITLSTSLRHRIAGACLKLGFRLIGNEPLAKMFEPLGDALDALASFANAADYYESQENHLLDSVCIDDDNIVSMGELRFARATYLKLTGDK